MYYQNYEDYMKNVLGPNYTPDYQNVNPYNYYAPTYAPTMARPIQPSEYNQIPVANNNVQEIPQQPTSNTVNISVSQTTEEVAKVKKMYPEIYTLLSPMIEKTIAENREKEITEELIETMTKQVYDAIEEDMNVKQVSTTPISLSDKNRNMNSPIKPVANNNIQVARRPGNTTLRDLIKILLINNIINNLRPNRPNPNPRPPHRPNERPPMPRMSYPVMNYFSTPYPEDEYIG